jgi:hypothetical protein
MGVINNNTCDKNVNKCDYCGYDASTIKLKNVMIEHDDWVLRHYHNTSKNKMLKVYKEAFYLACERLANIDNIGDGSFHRSKFLHLATKLNK